MRNTWLVALREFRQRLRARGFWFSAIGVPLMLFVIMGATGSLGGDTAATAVATQDAAPAAIGYVDEADLIQNTANAAVYGLTAYPDRSAAAAALADGQIEAYYVIPADYRDTGTVQRVAERLPGIEVSGSEAMDVLLRDNLVGDAPADLQSRLAAPLGSNGLRYVNTAARQSDGAAPGAFDMTPFIIVILIMIPLYSSGGMLLRSLTQEKSNRTMEILLVSLRPRELLSGKLLGLGAVTLVQYLVWGGLALLALIGSGRNPAAFFAAANLGAGQAVLMLLYAMGGYVLYAGLMAGLGALAPNLESSRTWIFLLSLPMMIPLYLWTELVQAPNAPLAVTLSLIPFSAPVAMMMRLGSAVIPLWQVEVSMVLLFLTGLGTVRLMARLFRVQTLLSGEGLSLQRVWQVLRSPEG